MIKTFIQTIKMQFKENRNILTGFSLLIITLMTFCIQFTDGKLQNHETLKQEKILEIIKSTGNENFWSNQRNASYADRTMYLITKNPIHFNTERFTLDHDPKYIAIITEMNQIYSEKGDQAQCFTKLGSFLTEKMKGFQKEHNELIEVYQNNFVTKPLKIKSLNGIKKICWIILVMALCFNIYIFCSSKKEKKNKKIGQNLTVDKK